MRYAAFYGGAPPLLDKRVLLLCPTPWIMRFGVFLFFIFAARLYACF
jgi:hypothetical protein